jgi:hypothetical protein
MLKILDKGMQGGKERRQPRRVKRIRNDTICTGAWNILTLLKAGKMNEIAD